MLAKHCGLTPASVHVNPIPATLRGVVVQDIATAEWRFLVVVIAKTGQVVLALLNEHQSVPAGALGLVAVVQYLVVAKFALNASAPPTTANNAKESNMILSFFIIDFAF